MNMASDAMELDAASSHSAEIGILSLFNCVWSDTSDKGSIDSDYVTESSSSSNSDGSSNWEGSEDLEGLDEPQVPVEVLGALSKTRMIFQICSYSSS